MKWCILVLLCACASHRAECASPPALESYTCQVEAWLDDEIHTVVTANCADAYPWWFLAVRNEQEWVATRDEHHPCGQISSTFAAPADPSEILIRAGVQVGSGPSQKFFACQCTLNESGVP